MIVIDHNPVFPLCHFRYIPYLYHLIFKDFIVLYGRLWRIKTIYKKTKIFFLCHDYKNEDENVH